MPYTSDRAFTDYVHDNLAISIIYPRFNWTVLKVPKSLAKKLDIGQAIDYVAVDTDKNLISVQERFREEKYRNFNDFTIRYMRPENVHEDRRESEFFKMEAEYFIYGIIDTAKVNYRSATGFVKLAVLNMNELMKKIDDGIVVIDGDVAGYTCQKEGNIMKCPVNENKDHSSNFVPFDITILKDVAPEVIIYQKGFC